MSRHTELLCSSTQSCHCTGQLTNITINLTWIQESPPHTHTALYCHAKVLPVVQQTPLKKTPASQDSDTIPCSLQSKRSPDPLVRAAWGSGLHHKFRYFTCAGTELGKDQKLTAAERQTACAASVLCQDFCASLKRILARVQDWLLHEAGG